MDRSTFLKRSGQIGLFSCGAVLLGTKGEKAEQQESQEGHLQRFKEDWVTTLMENMEAQIEEKTRFMLMQSCGRRCARRGAIQIAESCKNDVKKMADIFSKFPDLELTIQDEGSIHVTYGKCLCELVNHGPKRLPDTYCECSKGWLLEMFETAVQKSVDIEILQTIKRGGDSCKFVVKC